MNQKDENGIDECLARGSRAVCILTTAHSLDDVRVREKFARSFVASRGNVVWVGPDKALHKGFARDTRGYDYRLFQPRGGKLGRLTAFWQAWREALMIEPKPLLYYCPDPDSAYIALRLRRKTRVPILLDIHEVYHGRAMSHWGSGLVANCLSALIKRQIRRIAAEADYVAAVNQTVLDHYTCQGVAGTVVRNCPPSFLFADQLVGVRVETKTRFVLMHGKAARGRGTHTLLKAIKIAVGRGSRVLVIVFDLFDDSRNSRDEFWAEVDRLGVRCAIEMRQSVPPTAMPKILAECDAGLLLYGRDLGHASLPNRLFEYMAMGLAVIGPHYGVEISAIVKTEDCGVLIDCENPEHIADCICKLEADRALVKKLGGNGRTAFYARHNWESEFLKIAGKIDLPEVTDVS